MWNRSNSNRKPLNGFNVFLIIWAGQFVSTLGTGMTRFVLLIWAYQETGSATTLALLGFFAWLPYVIISPFAGVWVDRLDRRWVLILSDLGSGCMTLLLGFFFWQGELAIWHIYLLEGMTAVFDAFQAPASTLSPPSSSKKRITGAPVACVRSHAIRPSFCHRCWVVRCLPGAAWVACCSLT
jgi:MFS family permease